MRISDDYKVLHAFYIFISLASKLPKMGSIAFQFELAIKETSDT